MPAHLQWDADALAVRVDLDAFPDFRNPLQRSASNGALDLDTVFLGANFWRVSYDGNHWSEVEQFEVESGFLSTGRPQVTTAETQMPLLKAQVKGSVTLESSIPHLGFVVEASSDEQFVTERTRAFWSESSTLNLSFYKPGKFYYRFRTVSREQELTDWSETVAFTVFKPTRPLPPTLITQVRSEGLVGEKFALKYSSEAQSTEIEVFNSAGQTVAQYKGTSATLSPTTAGVYHVIAVAKNGYGLKSRPSPLLSITVKDKPVLQLAKAKPQPKRVPTAVSSSAIKAEPPVFYANEGYKKSDLGVYGFLWTMYSGEQVVNQVAEPVATGVGVRGLYWWDHSGVEGLASSEVLSLNKTGGQMALKDFEARYHYRFLTPFPFHLARELQVSLFAGAELYQNSSSYFVDSYDLIDFGTSLEFPVAEHWTMGGELAYGQGSGQSVKYEITGNLNYFFKKSWSLGCGYKVHLFQTESSQVAPMGYLPYREGYTELYTTIDYRF